MKEFNTNNFTPLIDKDLEEISGGASLSGTLLAVYNSIWPNNTAPMAHGKPSYSYFPQYSPYNYWY